jgi:hypothetical protein
MGNLNFTLESSNAQTRDAIFKNNLEFLKHNDELLALKRGSIQE